MGAAKRSERPGGLNLEPAGTGASPLLPIDAESAAADTTLSDLDPSWVNEAFGAFAQDVVRSKVFEDRVDEIVAERTAGLRAELDDLRDELRAVGEDLKGWASVPSPAPPLRLTPEEHTLLGAPYRGAQESVLFGGGRKTPPAHRRPRSKLSPLRVVVAVATFGAVCVLVAPHPGVVADAAPPVEPAVVYVPMPGTPEAPVPVNEATILPPNDAKFPTTTTTR